MVSFTEAAASLSKHTDKKKKKKRSHTLDRQHELDILGTSRLEAPHQSTKIVRNSQRRLMCTKIVGNSQRCLMCTKIVGNSQRCLMCTKIVRNSQRRLMCTKIVGKSQRPVMCTKVVRNSQRRLMCAVPCLPTTMTWPHHVTTIGVDMEGGFILQHCERSRMNF